MSEPAGNAPTEMWPRHKFVIPPRGNPSMQSEQPLFRTEFLSRPPGKGISLGGNAFPDRNKQCLPMAFVESAPGFFRRPRTLKSPRGEDVSPQGESFVRSRILFILPAEFLQNQNNASQVQGQINFEERAGYSDVWRANLDYKMADIASQDFLSICQEANELVEEQDRDPI